MLDHIDMDRFRVSAAQYPYGAMPEEIDKAPVVVQFLDYITDPRDSFDGNQGVSEIHLPLSYEEQLKENLAKNMSLSLDDYGNMNLILKANGVIDSFENPKYRKVLYISFLKNISRKFYRSKLGVIFISEMRLSIQKKSGSTYSEIGYCQKRIYNREFTNLFAEKNLIIPEDRICPSFLVVTSVAKNCKGYSSSDIFQKVLRECDTELREGSSTFQRLNI